MANHMNLPDTSHLTAELEAAFNEYESGKLSSKDYSKIRADICGQIKQIHRNEWVAGIKMGEER